MSNDDSQTARRPPPPVHGLRPAASAASAAAQARDVGAVVVAAVVLLAVAAALQVLSVAAACVLALAIAAWAIVWVRVIAPQAGRPRGAVAVLPAPVSPRAQFPLTPETGVAIIERLPDPIILLDRSGRIVLYNRAAMGIVGAAAARRHISTVLRVPGVLEAVAQVIAGAPAQVVEYEQPVPIERHYHAFVAPVNAPVNAPLKAGAQDISGNKHRNILILLHDLTTLKRAEQMRADFVANASHELRTPLASLAGFVETLRGPARDDAAARDKFLGIMQDQAERMDRLINDLLSLSRIELNEHVRPEDCVDLAAIVTDSVDVMAPLAAKEGVEVRLDVEPGLPHLLGDRDELVQVCQNLLANALKYGGSGKRVDVRVGRAGQPLRTGSAPSLMLSVQDYGPGIAREHLPRLTERFYRVDVEQSRQRGGTGLGLAIVKHIVNRHMGVLSIDSEKDNGSTFTVVLPVDPASDAARPAAAAARVAPPGGEGNRVAAR